MFNAHITHPNPSKEYRRKTALKLHMEVTHEKDKEYKCKNCDKIFTHKNYLSEHMKRIHEKNEFECSECKKIFSAKDDLQRHMKFIHHHTYTTEACSFCGKLFKQRRNLQTSAG